MKRGAAFVVLVLVICLTGGYLAWRYIQPKYSIGGTITRDGKPLKWKGDEGVLDVKFVPLDRRADENVYRAETDRKTGAYSIAGIPAGSYRVSIQQMDPFPTHDLLGFALSMAKSPIIRDVTRDDDAFHIDLPRDLPPTSK